MKYLKILGLTIFIFIVVLVIGGGLLFLTLLLFNLLGDYVYLILAGLLILAICFSVAIAILD
jgi:hypothetical protein